MQLLDYSSAQKLLREYRIKPAEGLLTQKADTQEVISLCEKMGYPVAIKLLSEDIIHKTEFGAVSAGINSPDEARKAVEKMLNRVNKINEEIKKEKTNAKKKRIKIDGILVQKMCEGQEVIIGMKHDPQFGQVIMFGLGGIFVEVIKDVVFRVAPINKEQAVEMINELKSSQVLSRVRGKKGVNLTALSELIANISKLAMENPNISEIDFNPVFVDTEKAVVADARILMNTK